LCGQVGMDKCGIVVQEGMVGACMHAVALKALKCVLNVDY